MFALSLLGSLAAIKDPAQNLSLREFVYSASSAHGISLQASYSYSSYYYTPASNYYYTPVISTASTLTGSYYGDAVVTNLNLIGQVVGGVVGFVVTLIFIIVLICCIACKKKRDAAAAAAA